MGLVAEKTDNSAERLIEAGRSLVAQGDARFSLTRLCSEAGVTLDEFRANFASKAELLQQLTDSPQPETPAPADPWLERRLRVFERALNALEEKAEKREAETRQAIAQLEEKLAALGAVQFGPVVAVRDRRASNRDGASAAPLPARETAAVPQDALEAAILAAPQESQSENKAEAEEKQEQEEVRTPDPALQLAPLEPMGPPSRADNEFLEAGRRAAQAHARMLEQAPRRRPIPSRLLLASALAALTLLLCAVLTLGHADYLRAAGESTAHRSAPLTPLQKLMARADSGDAVSQRDLALAYLRGQGVARDMAAASRWAQAAAEQGDAQAQYLAGSFYRDGAGVSRDAGRAFAWFAKAAAAGQLKAMHNLAISYVEGAGTTRNDAAAAAWFTRAAQRGYVDSAFDLAVLYEKGQGVAQDARQALHWYRVAAASGDAQAAARAALLAQQARL
jgi:localization factor PodJL